MDNSDIDSVYTWESSSTVKVKNTWWHCCRPVQSLNILGVLLWKSVMAYRQQWPIVLTIYAGIIISFLVGCIFMRVRIYPFKWPEEKSESPDLEIGPDWILSGSHNHTNGVVLIGYAPRYLHIETLMEQVERILVRNGLPVGIQEIQTVPFESEFSMDRFIHKQPGVLQYAFAFAIPGTSYPKLSPSLNMISYLHDRVCYNEQYPPCPGDVYVAKVIMEAFINAHSGRDNNFTLAFRAAKEDPRRRDPILEPAAIKAMDILYKIITLVYAWILVYIMAAERESIQLTFKRMGIRLGLNYLANCIILLPNIMILHSSCETILSSPLGGNVPIVVYSSTTVRLTFMVCFSTSLLTYCIMGSVLFKKAVQCVMISCLMLAVAMYLQVNWQPPAALQDPINVLLAVGQHQGISTALRMEKAVKGMQWKNLGLDFSLNFGGESPIRLIQLLSAAIPVQLLLAILAVYIRPAWQAWHSKIKNWLWPKPGSGTKFCQNMNHCEALPEYGTPCIVFEHVYTQGTYDVALKDINWTVLEGDVSVVIGLEGSGRLAILSVLYGDIRPVSGSATVFGLDCRRQTTKILRNCGVCLQNTEGVFQFLTVRDNFHIFSELRHQCQQRKKNNTNALVGDAKLRDVLDTQVKLLKDGDRVVLNVALAFAGDSKLIILEDPTKDMDVHTKMRVWNVIKNHSKDRTVLISTMCMEEAQMIGDHIAIFLDGHIHCSGTVPFLKTFFGIGYYLDIEKRRLSKAKSIRAICQYFCPNCVVLEDSLKRSIFLLPSSSDTTPVENILDCLEQNQIDLGIANYDLVGSTLENAFINLTSGCVQTLIKMKKCGQDKMPALSYKLLMKNRLEREEQPSGVCDTDVDKHEASSQSLATQHYSSMTIRSGIESRLSLADPDNDLNDEELADIARHKGVKLWLKRSGALFFTRFLIYCRRMNFELFQAAIIIVLVSYFVHDINHGWYFGEKVVDHRQTPEHFCPSFVPIAISGGKEALTRDAESRRLWNTLQQVLSENAESTCAQLLKCIPDAGNATKTIEDCISTNTVRLGLPSYGIRLTPEPQHLMRAVLFTSSRIPGKSLVPAMSAAMETFLHFATNDSSKKYEIHFRSMYAQPMLTEPGNCMRLGVVAVIVFIYIPYVHIRKRLCGTTLLLRLSGGSSFSLWMAHFLTDMVSYTVLAIVYFLVTQYTAPMFPKVHHTDYMIVVVMLYGAVNLVHIYCLQRFMPKALFGTAVIMLILFYSSEATLRYHRANNIENEVLHNWFLVLPGFFLPAYLCSFSHKYYVDRYCHAHDQQCDKTQESYDVHHCCLGNLNPHSGEPILYVIVGMVHLVFWTTLLFFLEYRIPSKIYRYFGERCFSWAKEGSFLQDSSAFTALSVNTSLVCVPQSISRIARAGSMSGSVSTVTPFYGLVGPAPLNSTVTSVDTKVHHEVTFIDQGNEYTEGKEGKESGQNSDHSRKGYLTSSDNFRKSIELQRNRTLLIHKLQKFPTLLEVSATITAGEVFCFVSSDMSVSSDLLRCICGWERFDSGQIMLGGKLFGWRHPWSPVTIGYCSREEAIANILTLRETLALHCALRGAVDVNKEVNIILKVFELTAYADMESKNISDCTLARLRVARALVGEPDLVLLDQPLANLDSVGKITVWNAIDRARKRGQMIIMTSNSIDECANLASRVAIVVQGLVMFVNSPKILRSRFCNSYSLTARLDATDMKLVDILVPSLSQRFPNSEIFVDSLNYLHVLLPFKTDSLAEIFHLMASVKKHLKVSDFVLRHTTMDNLIGALEKDAAKNSNGDDAKKKRESVPKSTKPAQTVSKRQSSEVDLAFPNKPKLAS